MRHTTEQRELSTRRTTRVQCHGASPAHQGNTGDVLGVADGEPNICAEDGTRSLFRSSAASVVLSLALLASPGALDHPVIMHPGHIGQNEEVSRSLQSWQSPTGEEWEQAVLERLGLRLPSAHAGVLASLKSSKTFDKVLMALGGPLVTSDTVSNMLQTEPDEGNLAGSIVDDLVESLTQWTPTCSSWAKGRLRSALPALVLQGFFRATRRT